MKIAIIYKSLTGNTQIIAQAIKDALNPEDVVYFGEPKEDIIDSDLYIIGSWTSRGSCVKEIASLLASLKNKKIAYFGTAGFGGQVEYYESLFQRAKAFIDESNTIIGHFFCQGKMPMNVKEKYVQMIKEHPDDEKLKVSIKNFDEALSHPDSNDIQQAQLWIHSLIEKSNLS